MSATYVLSAQQQFKLDHPRRIRGAAAVAVVLLAILWWVLPVQKPTPYRLRVNELRTMDIEIEAPPVAELPRPEPVVRVPVDIVAAAPGVEPQEVPIWNVFEPVVPSPGPWAWPSQDDAFVIKQTLPRLLEQPRADYPAFARAQGIAGTVVVEALVSAEGTVVDVRIIGGVHPLLDQAALQAARRCRFTPGRQRELAVPVRVALPYRFSLH
jgi:TonB family protein